VTEEYPTCVEVAIALPVFNTFTYSVPENLIRHVLAGKRVVVPFGNRRVTGYLMGSVLPEKGIEIREIIDILDDLPVFPDVMIPFFKWAAAYYFHPIGAVIKTALPGGLNPLDVSLIEITQSGIDAVGKRSLPPHEKKILRMLLKGSLRFNEINRLTSKKRSLSLVRSMTRRGLVAKRRELRAGRVKTKLERFVSFKRSPDSVNELSDIKNKIVDLVRDAGEVPVRQLKMRIPQAPRHISHLEKKGILKIFHRRVYRDPFGESIEPDTPPRLTEEQETVLARVLPALGGGFAAYLLAGVTGSGKTEVYLRLAEAAVDRQHAVIVLVPEVALITQMERRFRARFGERIAVLHSGLSAGERYDQWDRILRGDVSIAIGARSALFAPFSNIGMIIVDEEHDGSYKQESGLRYNARDLALVRARQNNALALLGSATPSIQSYHNASTGKLTRLRLTKRVHGRPFPEMTVVDLRHTRDSAGVRKFLTPTLLKAMGDTLGRGEQVLLFLNRRGYASYPVCSACGENLRCKYCDISLTLHMRANAYKCHYCGFTQSATAKCPGCGSSKIRHLGLGTEKLETAIKELFPRSNVTRMDRDTTTRKGATLKILKALKNGIIDILVGTQMVTKGHDFPNITLVGIVCADLSLGFPDFRAAERTFQLLAQVSGRAGRGEAPGRVVLQTYNPGHFSIRFAGDQDYDAFFQKEIGFRQALNYPPFSRIVQLKISGKDKTATRRQAEVFGDVCRHLKGDGEMFSSRVDILGPIEAPMPKIAGRYRWQLILKGALAKHLKGFVSALMKKNPKLFNSRDVRVVLDVDPYLFS